MKSLAPRSRPVSLADILPLAYLALPTLLFLVGWIAPWYGWPAAAALCLCVSFLLRDRVPIAHLPSFAMIAVVALVAVAWTVLGGIGHFVYANTDWLVRDAVFVDLVTKPWPVVYDTVADGQTLLRAPIGFYLPAATIGKLLGVHAAELALLAWTSAGVAMTFLLLLRDRPTPLRATVRIAVFVLFSGMDIVGTYTHLKPFALGDHIEWWAFLFQYSSQTTQLFWVPNHALPGWIAIAWLLGHDRRALPIGVAVVVVALVPLWSPLTAVGLAPIFAVAILREGMHRRLPAFIAALCDVRALVVVLLCGVLIYPYLTLGSATLASGLSADVRFVGEDIVVRYIEFVIFEFALFAALLLWRDRRDPLLWAAVAILLLLPTYRFGPANDLAMRASIPALTLLAIRLGQWLSSSRGSLSDTQARGVAFALLAIGAVTPFMEVARVFVEPRWPMDTTHGLMDITRGPAPHYLTPSAQPWPDRFLGHPR